MGTGFLTQASNKRAITLDLKTERGREILKKLVATADVFVENYPPGAFEALGLGYEDLVEDQSAADLCVVLGLRPEGPRGEQTAYDHVIQATSGIMAMTGTKDVHPDQVGSPGDRLRHRHDRRVRAFGRAVPARAHRQGPAHRHGDARCRDDPDELASRRLLRNGVHPKPQRQPPFARDQRRVRRQGRRIDHARRQQHPQQKRLWTLLGRPEHDQGGRTTSATPITRARSPVLDEIMLTRTADEWEEFLQARHVPACRVRTMGEAVADPQIATRGIMHRHDGATACDGAFGVPLAAFTVRAWRPEHRDAAAGARRAQRRRFSPSSGTGRRSDARRRR
jgi:crotonobetainyl-CoA:carnitine CoA-transferase CaiB-like acyl-CoA transferase